MDGWMESKRDVQQIAPSCKDRLELIEAERRFMSPLRLNLFSRGEKACR